MIYGIFSDVHANLEALNQVLEALEVRGAERLVCLGDIVGYGPNPNEVTSLIREKCAFSILGNHDNVALGREAHVHFNPHAQKSIDWTQKVLNEETKEYLGGLPYLVREEGCYFVHASPKSPSDWFYVNSLDDSVEALDFCPDQICFIGHTHFPSFVIKENDQSYKVPDENYYKLGENERILVNVGSTGQPRDKIPKASAVIFNSETLEFEILRIEYEISETQAKMQELNFPSFLIHRLGTGQ